VIGCGLGVLIRIAWVFLILAYRATFRRRSDEYEEVEVVEYVVFEEEGAAPPYPSAEEEKQELN
jgi:hypothetical protein